MSADTAGQRLTGVDTDCPAVSTQNHRRSHTGPLPEWHGKRDATQGRYQNDMVSVVPHRAATKMAR